MIDLEAIRRDIFEAKSEFEALVSRLIAQATTATEIGCYRTMPEPIMIRRCEELLAEVERLQPAARHTPLYSGNRWCCEGHELEFTPRKTCRR